MHHMTLERISEAPTGGLATLTGLVLLQLHGHESLTSPVKYITLLFDICHHNYINP